MVNVKAVVFTKSLFELVKHAYLFFLLYVYEEAVLTCIIMRNLNMNQRVCKCFMAFVLRGNHGIFSLFIALSGMKQLYFALN